MFMFSTVVKELGWSLPQTNILQTQTITGSKHIVGAVVESREWRPNTKRRHRHTFEPNAKLSLIKTKHAGQMQQN